ncbi:MAG TPA: hypothetical protein PK144_05350 [Plasticicumulans sp.]|nr:hypothetical protein [Plasticicumulans sp.]HNI24573.1 hypothetical protein [Plasticicumulans sp.]
MAAIIFLSRTEYSAMLRRFTLQRSLAPALAGILMISALPAPAQQQGNSNAASASSTPTSCEDAVAQQVRKQCPREASRVCAEAVRKAVAQSCSPQQQVRNQQLAQQTSQVPSPETAGTGAGETGLAAGAVEATVLGVPVIPLGIATVLAVGIGVAAGGGSNGGGEDSSGSSSAATPSHH